LIVSFWRSMFEIGKITEDQLHALSAYMFAGAPGRRYWTVAGPHQRAHYVSERDRRFVEILDQEYTKAAVSTPAAESRKPKVTRLPPAGSHSTIATLALGVAGGAILSEVVSATRRRAQRIE
jgi:hypothetical protein